jgi:hypothetical protein
MTKACMRALKEYNTHSSILDSFLMYLYDVLQELSALSLEYHNLHHAHLAVKRLEFYF